MDAHANLMSTLVATAPSPATSGTSLVVTTGASAHAPAVPFNFTVGPDNAEWDWSNTEILRCTNISTETWTVARAQEGSTARTVVVGDRIRVGVTKKTLTDIEAVIATAATRQVFTSGSGTYTTPAGCKYIEVELVGAGGGGQGSGTTPGSGGTGGDTTFSTLTGSGGVGNSSSAADGGAASGGNVNIPGGSGDGQISGVGQFQGGHGGSSFFGGGGGGGAPGTAGKTGATNSGGGGGGAANNTVGAAGGGGGAGGYARKIIATPAATYSYAVGAAGTAGTAGTSGTAGGAGAAGIIIVTEYY